MRAMRIVAVLCALALAPSAGAAADPRTERLSRLARLWGEVKYVHPWIVTQQIDWDAALLAAIPKVSDAETPDAEIAALRSLLESLHDPSTVLETDGEAPMAPPTSSRWEWAKKDVLVIHLVRLSSFEKLTGEERLIAPELAKARVVLIDVRSQPRWVAGIEDAGDELELLLPRLTGIARSPPAVRSTLWFGQPTQVPGFGEGNSVNLVERLSRASAAPPMGGQRPSSHKPDRVVLLADASSPLPLSVLGAIRSGGIRLVAQGPIDDSYAAGLQRLPLLPHVVARVRAGVLDPPIAPDTSVPAKLGAGSDPGFDFALAWAQRKRPAARRPARAVPPLATALLPEKSYRESPLPDPSHRLLALFRFWNGMERFYPYRRLLDQPWEEALPAMIPKFEAASTEREYLLALNELGARLQDAHVHVVGTEAAQTLFYAATLPLRLQILDGQAVVADVPDEEARKAGLAPGDVIVAIDGEPIATRARNLEKYVSAATPLMLTTLAHYYAMGGPRNSVATVSVLGAGGPREVKLTRQKPFYPSPRPGPIVQVLDGNVGYVDLARLQLEAVDAMFDQVMSTKALVFDMRGFPRETAWAVAPRLNRKNALYGAVVYRPVAGGAITGEESLPSLEFHQLLPVSDKPKYEGRVFLLIDERAISLAEHTALFLEAVCDLTVVGSNSAGTNGEVTAITLPGGLLVMFTGSEARHADGRQLQRIGIQPQVVVRPTPAGLRAGRDEVLENALSLARGGVARQ